MTLDRRSLLAAGAAALSLPAAVARAAAIDAAVRAGTIADVEHVVILMQENRAFDHYFGTLNGVRGFADRFPIPVEGEPGRTVWTQGGGPEAAPLIAPFPLDTTHTFAHMRVEGTPHGWPDSQAAWDHGRMARWPRAKTPHAMGFYGRDDIPFQFALADAFTVCDAYHCAIQSSTNPNRLFLWTATNDPSGAHGGPAIANSHDRFAAQGGWPASYTWTTYPERLQAAGVSWRLYQDMADNFTDNPLAGFKAYREAFDGAPGADGALKTLALSTRKLDRLREDVLGGRLPAVSYIIAPAADSEHPGPSSPAQGADFTARVLDALTADPKVWSRTVLLLMFDENDGFFDHVPPPAPPSRDPSAPGGRAGASTVDTAGEYHLVASKADATSERPELIGRPYGLGARVPMLVISPWSRGGWVASEVFDHTSVIRFLEARFGVMEPNISPWRRAVCGDLTSVFDFRTPNRAPGPALPQTQRAARRAAALPGRTTPPTPGAPAPPSQAAGPRLSRPLPYALEVSGAIDAGRAVLDFHNHGKAGAVFHVYDCRHLDRIPRRYTVAAGQVLRGEWPLAEDAGAYDLWVLGPNGFHRRFRGSADGGGAEVAAAFQTLKPKLTLALANPGPAPLELLVSPGAYQGHHKPWRVSLRPKATATRSWPLADTRGWYDLSVTAPGAPLYLRRLAGRLETGRPSISDPAMAGEALMRDMS